MNSQYADERKNAIKRVIASMTVGKDLSSVFPDVLKSACAYPCSGSRKLTMGS